MKIKRKSELSGRKVLAIFIGFFVVVFAANGIMTWVAVATFSGIETEDAYRKGRDYNTELADARAQSQLGWQVALKTVSLGSNQLAIGVEVASHEGAARSNMAVEMKLLRPTHRGMDIAVPLKETAIGTFASEVSLPAPGNWKALVVARSPEGEEYRVEKKLFVRE